MTMAPTKAKPRSPIMASTAEEAEGTREDGRVGEQGFICQLSRKALICSSSRAMRSPALAMEAMASSSTTLCAPCGNTNSRR